MYKVHSAKLDAKGKNLGIVVSRFNDFITKVLLDGAIDKIIRLGGSEENIDVTWVPGAFELPLICQKMAETKKFDSIIALGAIIRGSTYHYELVANETAKGIARVSLDTKIPIIFGIITCDTIEQAIERAGTKVGNKGASAAETAIEMTNLLSDFNNDLQ